VSLFGKRASLSVVEVGKLKAALAARDQAQQSVLDARATLERLESIVKLSNDASRAAADATRAANDFRASWVRNGCQYAASLELKALEDVAAEKSREAERAAVNGDAVALQLARARDLVQYAQGELRSREKDIAAERGAQLVAEQAQQELLEDLLQSAARTRRLRYRAKALLRAVQPGQFEDQSAASSAAASVVEDAINAARVEDWERERSAAADHDFVQGRRGADEAAFEAEVRAFRARAVAIES